MHYGHETLNNVITNMGMNFWEVFEPYNTGLETDLSPSVLVNSKPGSEIVGFEG